MGQTERQEAIAVANKILDDPNRDPDSGESILARQFRRLGDPNEVHPQAAFDAIVPELLRTMHDSISRDWIRKYKASMFAERRRR